MQAFSYNRSSKCLNGKKKEKIYQELNVFIRSRKTYSTFWWKNEGSNGQKFGNPWLSSYETINNLITADKFRDPKKSQDWFFTMQLFYFSNYLLVQRKSKTAITFTPQVWFFTIKLFISLIICLLNSPRSSFDMELPLGVLTT